MVYIDSQATSWNDFTGHLQKELSLRPPNWPIYLESDGDVDWGYAAQTIDAIHGLRAEVVLLPPTIGAQR